MPPYSVDVDPMSNYACVENSLSHWFQKLPGAYVISGTNEMVNKLCELMCETFKLTNNYNITIVFESCIFAQRKLSFVISVTNEKYRATFLHCVHSIRDGQTVRT